MFKNKMSATCPIRETCVKLILDGFLRYCQCRNLSINHTNHYTRYARYLGVYPKEHPNFKNGGDGTVDNILNLEKCSNINRF